MRSFTHFERMETSDFYKSKNPFPLETSLKIKVDKKNVSSYTALPTIRVQIPLTYQEDVCHPKCHYARYKNQCFKNAAKDLNFSKEVVKHRGPGTLSYKECDLRYLYDYSSVIHEQKRDVTANKQRPPSRLKALKKRPHMMKSNVLAKPTTMAAPFYQEESILQAKIDRTLAEASLQEPFPTISSPYDSPDKQTFLTELHENLGTLMIQRQSKKFSRDVTIQEPEYDYLGWEDKLLKKLNRATAQWIVNNQSSWGGWVQGKILCFKKQKYDWNSIRYVLPSENDVELLNTVQAEQEAMECPVQHPEEKKPETPLPLYYRVPSAHSRVLSIDDPFANNRTVDEISENSLKAARPIKRRERLSSRVGKYSYTTQNVFEQQLYFGTAKIVHQEIKKDCIVMDNHDVYCKRLQQHYPRPPEVWNFRPPKKTAERVQMGAVHWKALPLIVEDFPQLGQAEFPVSPGRKRQLLRQPKKLESQDISIRKTMLEDWKSAWMVDPQWQSATIEGLMRDLVDLHVQNRINAILICASAVLYRPEKIRDENKHSVIELEAGAKKLEVQDLPEKIQTLLRNTLFDEDAHVRVTSAVCHYAIGDRHPMAHIIMKQVLVDGNAADSWAAAQCLALEGFGSFQVIKRILSQIFDQKDKTTDEQACVLLSRLSKQTGLVHCLLASELNSYQWKHRVMACKVFSRIAGTVSKDLQNKIAQLMWTDWKFDVRKAAAQALGHLELGKEVHDQLRAKLKRGNCQMRVEALSLIGWLQLMTAKLLPSFLRCFSDDFVAVRKEACQAAGTLRIKDEKVLKCLFKIMQTDPFWKIKALAIRALGQIGQASPQLEDLLLWALHYEEEPGVRREACRSIITLQLQDERVRATLLERRILEPHETVRKEVNHAMTVFNFQQEEEQEMIQTIKYKIATLSQKDFVTQKLLKLQQIIERTWHEAHRIYREKDDVFIYREIKEIFLEVVKYAFNGQTPSPSRKLSKIWTSLSSLLPLMGIPPNPWTQRAFLEALEAYYAQRRVRAKKQQTPTKKRKESRVTQKNEETLPIVHFVPNDQSIT